MARRKDTGAQVTETVVEETPGETHIHRTVREWHPHAPERLAEIEAIIDSWGRRSTESAPARRLGDEELQQRVDRLTKRVKGSRKVVVQEKVTEWVERPVAEEPEPAPTRTEAAVEETVAVHEDSMRTRPKRRFQILGFIGKRNKAAKPKKADKAKAKGKPVPDPSDSEYQPQCAALTEDGQQCRNSARGVSRYCSSHKGYQPPTAKGLAKRIEGDAWDPRDQVTDHQSVKGADTRPVVRKAKDTRIKVRKAPKKASKSSRKSSKKSGRKKR
ncbi:MAG: hypothetical protein ACYC2H_02110 [Thermoplasmatota archaeon]